MTLFSTASITMALCSVLLVTAPSVSAEPPHKRNHKHAAVRPHSVANKVVVARLEPNRINTTVAALGLNLFPIRKVRFLHNDEFFYYSDGGVLQKEASRLRIS